MMDFEYNNRGLERVSIKDRSGTTLKVYQCPHVGDYADSFKRWGSVGVWINVEAPKGELPACLLNREQAHELGRRLITWAKTGSLKLEGE